MQVLVTGGAGYVGSVIVHKLVDSGYDVIIVGNLRHDRRKYLPKNIKICVGDIGDENILNQIFSQHTITHVIHCAAYIDISESMSYPVKYFNNNIGNTIKLLKVMELYGCKNIVFSSSCATYGVPTITPIPEDHPQDPITTYGWTKLVCEQMLGYMERISDFNVTILRYFNVGGAYIKGDFIVGENHDPETHLIPLAIKAMINSTSFNVYGTDYETPDGTAIRDYIHVEDLADAHILSLGKRGKFNLGGEKGYSVNEVLELIQKYGEKELDIKKCPRRKGTLGILYASSDKFKRDFEW
jgi:UDP-glucose 4-epimerase